MRSDAIRLGYHPATYRSAGLSSERFLDDMAELGWDGFEVAGIWLMEEYEGREAELCLELRSRGLELASIYTSAGYATAEEVEHYLTQAERVARFCCVVGCRTLLMDGGRCNDDGYSAEDYHRVADAANRAGAIAQRHGLTLSWHQHWGTMFEYPADFARLMALTDPQLVRFTPDTAQLTLGGFDVAQTFREYLARIHYVHFKDLGLDRRFIELGSGQIDFRPLSQLLLLNGFEGWVVTDLDYTSLPPKDSAQLNLRALRSFFR